MTVAMPAPDQSVLARRDRIVAGLRAIVPGEGVIAAEREMRPYESDGLTAYRQLPMVVVLPETTEQVSRVLAFCHAERIKVVPRGAGTSLSGGALPLEPVRRLVDLDRNGRRDLAAAQVSPVVRRRVGLIGQHPVRAGPRPAGPQPGHPDPVEHHAELRTVPAVPGGQDQRQRATPLLTAKVDLRGPATPGTHPTVISRLVPGRRPA